MKKKVVLEKKSYFRFDNVHVFFFVALVLNYGWRYLQEFTFNSFDTVYDLIEGVRPEFVSNGLVWFPDNLGTRMLGWTFNELVSLVVWAIAIYSLYLLYINIKEKKQVVASTILLIVGVLFYILSIFYSVS